MAKESKYTKKVLEEAVSLSTSINGVLRFFNLKITGSNHSYLSKKIRENKISTKHFINYKENLKPGFNKHSKESFINSLNENKTYTGTFILNKLISLNIKERMCEICNLKEWNNKEIPLEIDHINGCHEDNRLENLRLLCPNCHAQTDTYSGKKNKTPL